MNPGILVTGGAGLLAANWADAVKHRFAVTLGLHERRIAMQGVECRVVNLDSAGAVEVAIREAGAAIVVHCAAMANVEECEAAPHAAHHANVEIARNVAQACKSRGAKLVHISTDHVFSGTRSLMDEQAAIGPINVYAQTKAAGEAAVIDACPDAIIARTNFFGWGLPYRKSFSDTIIDTLRGGGEISLFQDAYFSPILMGSLIDATHALVDKGAQGLFHVVGDDRLSKYEFGLLIAHAFRLDRSLVKPTSLLARKDLARRPLDLSLSNRKMRDALCSELPDLSMDSQLKLLVQQKPMKMSVS
jgi:dTDP-4-dehydrorhamnose reductase